MTDKKEVAASVDATTTAVKQLADWLLTEPNDGNPLCFAGPPEPTVLGLSRVKMRSVSGDEWTLIAGLHEGWLTAEERAANFFRIAKLEREEVEREEGAAQQEPDAKLEHARAEYWKSAHARAAKQLRKLHRSQHAAPPVPSVDSAVPKGWRLVPVEPTSDMFAAADKMPHEFSIGDEYRTMLAAAPAPSTAAQGATLTEDVKDLLDRIEDMRLASKDEGHDTQDSMNLSDAINCIMRLAGKPVMVDAPLVAQQEPTQREKESIEWLDRLCAPSMYLDRLGPTRDLLKRLLTTGASESTTGIVEKIRGLFQPWPDDEPGPTDEPESQNRFGYNTAVEDVLGILEDHAAPHAADSARASAAAIREATLKEAASIDARVIAMLTATGKITRDHVDEALAKIGATAAPADQAGEREALPPLPAPKAEAWGNSADARFDAYSADQMREYAHAALRTAPAGEAQPVKHAEAERIINRLMSSDPQFDDCEDAANLIRRLLSMSLSENEQYRMQMAGISTAALGYWKEGDSVHPDYDTPSLRDVAKLYVKYDTLYRASAAPAGAGELTEARILDWCAEFCSANDLDSRVESRMAYALCNGLLAARTDGEAS